MNPTHTIRRLASILAGLATAALALAAAAPAALARPAPPGPGPAEIVPAPALHTAVVAGGMPGWQITLIAAGAAALAAALALLLARAWAARRHPLAPTA
jgi:hypothetical protein